MTKTTDNSHEVVQKPAFCARLAYLFDRAGINAGKRNSQGARLLKSLKIKEQTIGLWLNKKAPTKPSFDKLVNVAEALLKEVKGTYDPVAVAAWIYAGDTIDNPFDRRVTPHSTELLYRVNLRIEQIADSDQTVNLAKFTIEERAKILQDLCTLLKRRIQYREEEIDNGEYDHLIRGCLIAASVGFNHQP